MSVVDVQSGLFSRIPYMNKATKSQVKRSRRAQGLAPSLRSVPGVNMIPPGRNAVVTAPVAQGLVRANPRKQVVNSIMHPELGPGLRVCGSDYLCGVDVSSTNAGVITSGFGAGQSILSISPDTVGYASNALALLCRTFTSYRFTSLRFIFSAGCPTSFAHNLVMAYSAEGDTVGLTTYDSQSLASLPFAAETPCWQSITLDVPVVPRTRPIYYTEIDTSTISGYRDTVQGTFFMMRRDTVSVADPQAIGAVYIEYTLELYNRVWDYNFTLDLSRETRRVLRKMAANAEIDWQSTPFGSKERFGLYQEMCSRKEALSKVHVPQLFAGLPFIGCVYNVPVTPSCVSAASAAGKEGGSSSTKSETLPTASAAAAAPATVDSPIKESGPSGWSLIRRSIV